MYMDILFDSFLVGKQKVVFLETRSKSPPFVDFGKQHDTYDNSYDSKYSSQYAGGIFLVQLTVLLVLSMLKISIYRC